MSAHSITSRGLAGRKIPQGTLTPIGTLLFSGSEPGAWYDPSDLSTLFQDAAGTTPVTAVEQPVGRMLDKSGRGNHATQATTTKRPVLSRRVNLRSPSQGFTGFSFQDLTPASISVSGFSGFNTGFSLRETATVNSHRMTGIAVPTNAPAKLTIIIKPVGRNSISIGNAGINHTTINLTTLAITGHPGAQTKVTLLHDGYLLVEETRLWQYPGAQILIDLSAGAYLGDVNKGLDVAGIDVRLAIDAHLPYQWVNTATDYDADPAKFPAYRRLDGVDGSHASATGGGGTSGFFFSAAVTPQGGAGTARTLFSDAGTNTGYIVRLNTSNQLELSAGNGTTYTTIATAGTLAVGSTDIVQAWDDGTNLNVKIGNGATASIARPTVSAGTAGYTMGQDNGASTGYFNGRIYSTIYRKDSGLTQVQRESVALYQRQKARMP